MRLNNSSDAWPIVKIPALTLARWLLVFSVVVFLLVAALGVVLSSSRGAVQPVAPDDSILQGLGYTPIVQQSEPMVIADRPLFWSSRTPYQPEPEVIPEPEPEPVVKNTQLDNVVLLAVFLTHDTSQIVLEDKKSKVALQLGERYQGWQLVQVDPASAKFVRTDSIGSDSPVEWEVLLKQRDSLPIEWPGTRRLPPQNN